MKPFTFALMLQLQRVDEAWRLEKLKSPPDHPLLAMLRKKRQVLGERVRRSLAAPKTAEG